MKIFGWILVGYAAYAFYDINQTDYSGLGVSQSTLSSGINQSYLLYGAIGAVGIYLVSKKR